jgi:hypothetical protein
VKFFRSLSFQAFLPVLHWDWLLNPQKRQKLREWKKKQREAILHLDTTAMEKLWDKDLAVNLPTHNVVDKAGGMFAFKNGYIHYFYTAGNRKNYV